MKGDHELYSEIYFKWRTIGKQLGVSPRTMQRWCKEANIHLPNWNGYYTEAVWVPKKQIGVLIQVLLRSSVRRKLILVAKKKKLSYYAMLEN